MALPSPRRARPADAAALNALVNSAYRGASSRAGWTTEADLLGGQRVDEDGLRELIAAKDSVVLLFGDAELTACVHLQRRGDAAYLGMLTVKPTEQATGIGRAVLQAAEDFAQREWGAKRVEMTVIRARVELIAWYERRGYRNTGREEPFPVGDVRFGIPKVAGLAFVVLTKDFEKGP